MLLLLLVVCGEATLGVCVYMSVCVCVRARARAGLGGGGLSYLASSCRS